MEETTNLGEMARKIADSMKAEVGVDSQLVLDIAAEFKNGHYKDARFLVEAAYAFVHDKPEKPSEPKERDAENWLTYIIRVRNPYHSGLGERYTNAFENLYKAAQLVSNNSLKSKLSALANYFRERATQHKDCISI